MRKNAKVIVSLLLALVLIASCFALVACSGSDGFYSRVNSDLGGGNDKAIVMVTALMSGGLYDNETNEAIWDPFYFTDLNLLDFLWLLEEEDMMNSAAFTNILDKALATKIPDSIKDKSGDPYDGFLMYGMDLLNPILDYPGPTATADDYEYFVDTYGSLNASLLHRITLDQDGVPLNKSIVPTNDYNGPYDNIKYGVLGGYKDQNKILAEMYPNVDVVTFNYDWRLDGQHNADLLNKFIHEQKKYKEIILCTHSLGGQVCNRWLAMDPKNREMTKAFLMYSPATVGATMALAYLNNFWDALDNFADMLGQIGNIPAVGSIIAPMLNNALDPLMNGQARDFLITCSSITQLLPSFQMVKTYHEKWGEWIIKDKNGNDCDTEDKLFDYYYSCEWAWKIQEDENGHYVRDEQGNPVYVLENGKPVLKKIIAGLREWQHSLYVDVDGVETLAADLVDTYYLIGTDRPTIATYNDDSNGPQFTYSMSDTSGPNRYTEETASSGPREAGDGIVPFYGLLCGHTEEQIEALYGEGHIFKYSNIDHNIVGCDFTDELIWPNEVDDTHPKATAGTGKDKKAIIAAVIEKLGW